MRPRDRRRARRFDEELRSFDQQKHRLPGIRTPASRNAFIEQLVESVRRIEYISAIRSRDISDRRVDPSNELFDPLKAAVLHQRNGRVDESFWLVFLSVHFGKNRRTGWRLAADVYGRLGSTVHWDWAQTASDPQGFRRWLAAHHVTLQGADGNARHFGNHRKYQSLDAWSNTGTGAAVESYVNWVGRARTHELLIQEAQNEVGGDRRSTFDILYRSMRAVASFGRTARFDYLTMVGKLGLADIEPGSTYMQGATGPFTGACLLFTGRKIAALSRRVLDQSLVELEADLGVGMQVLEDALCNWQKNPTKFEPFRG